MEHWVRIPSSRLLRLMSPSADVVAAVAAFRRPPRMSSSRSGCRRRRRRSPLPKRARERDSKKAPFFEERRRSSIARELSFPLLFFRSRGRRMVSVLRRRDVFLRPRDVFLRHNFRYVLRHNFCVMIFSIVRKAFGEVLLNVSADLHWYG